MGTHSRGGYTCYTHLGYVTHNEISLMEVEDIVAFKIRHNLDKKCREEFFTHNRMYLYAILFHIHKWSLERIGKLFSYKEYVDGEWIDKPRNHATIRHALKEAHFVQHHVQFQENTKLLQDQLYFLIPPYKNGNQGAPKKPKYEVTVELNKERYINFLKGKDVEEIYEVVYQLTLEKMKSKINTIKKRVE